MTKAIKKDLINGVIKREDLQFLSFFNNSFLNPNKLFGFFLYSAEVNKKSILSEY